MKYSSPGLAYFCYCFIVFSVAELYLTIWLATAYPPLFGVLEVFRFMKFESILLAAVFATSFLPPGFDPTPPGPKVPPFSDALVLPFL